MTDHIIFHHPLPLQNNSASASGIRPVRMLEAFRELGYEVDVVAGDVSQRRSVIHNVIKKIRSGRRYRFMYAESSTMPTALTEPHHFPVAPLLDPQFFGYLKQQGIPIGLFYRDIYWLFNSYDERVAWFKRQVSRWFYRYDLRWYGHTLTRLYLPSLAMARHLPLMHNTSLAELPPGLQSTSPMSVVHPLIGTVRLLYVGGMSSHYQMHALFEAIACMPQVKLTICTRASEWDAVRSEYVRWMSPNIEIVYRSGHELDHLYSQSDVAIVFVRPDDYWQFAAPVKVYEYLGRCRPLLATEGTLAGRFVAENNIGWTIPYNVNSVLTLLKSLLVNPTEIISKSKACAMIAPMHTWQARARQVALDLGALR